MLTHINNFNYILIDALTRVLKRSYKLLIVEKSLFTRKVFIKYYLFISLIKLRDRKPTL